MQRRRGRTSLPFAITTFRTFADWILSSYKVRLPPGSSFTWLSCWEPARCYFSSSTSQ